jgi:hypothetical protein
LLITAEFQRKFKVDISYIIMQEAKTHGDEYFKKELQDQIKMGEYKPSELAVHKMKLSESD